MVHRITMPSGENLLVPEWTDWFEAASVQFREFHPDAPLDFDLTFPQEEALLTAFKVDTSVPYPSRAKLDLELRVSGTPHWFPITAFDKLVPKYFHHYDDKGVKHTELRMAAPGFLFPMLLPGAQERDEGDPAPRLSLVSHSTFNGLSHYVTVTLIGLRKERTD